MKFASISLFVAILVNPFGGGKVPAVSHVEMTNLPTNDVLLLVLVVSLVQVALLTLGADAIKLTVNWITGKLPWSRRPREQKRHVIPEVTHPALRYGLIGLLPIAPAGGGMLWAIFLKEVWGLDSRITIPLIAFANWIGFLIVYALADTFGLLTFLIGFVALIAAAYLIKRTASWLSHRRLILDHA